MTITINAQTKHVIVKVIPKSNTTEGGLVIPESARDPEPQATCEVVSVGVDCAADVKIGDHIWCHENGGQAIMVDRAIYKVLKDDEIYAVIKRG